MNIIEILFTSGMVGTEIVVPVLRSISSAFLALAVSRDCKARDNGSSTLWGFLTFLAPAFFVIFYFVYSRFLTDRKPETYEDKKSSHISKVLCIIAVLTYIVMIAVLVISVIISVSSGIVGTLKGI